MPAAATVNVVANVHVRLQTGGEKTTAAIAVQVKRPGVFSHKTHDSNEGSRRVTRRPGPRHLIVGGRVGGEAGNGRRRANAEKRRTGSGLS